MKMFWHSSWQIDDKTDFARLALAFEDIVVPDASEGYFPHAQLQLPPVPLDLPPQYQSQLFWPSTARAAVAFHPNSAFPSWEEAYVKFGEEFADAQYAIVRAKEMKFEYFLRTAALNDGVVLGNTELSASDFTLWLEAGANPNSSLKRFPLLCGLLSLAGVKVALPRVKLLDQSQVHHVKTKYREELGDYQLYIQELLGDSWDMMKSDPTYDDLVKWAGHIADTKIAPALRRLESAIREGDRNLLWNMAEGLGRAAPHITSAAIAGTHAPAILTVIESALDVVAPVLAKSIRERRTLKSAFGLSYLYRLRDASPAQPRASVS